MEDEERKTLESSGDSGVGVVHLTLWMLRKFRQINNHPFGGKLNLGIFSCKDSKIMSIDSQSFC